MTAYYERLVSPVGAGLLVMVLVLLAGGWSARHQPRHLAAVTWAALAGLAAFGLSEVLVQVLAERRPYAVIKGAEVLVARAPGHAFPSARAALAGAVACGLLIAHRWKLAGLAVLAAALLAFAGVYVGVDYPSDAAGGVVLGAAVAMVLWPLGSWLLVPVVTRLGVRPSGRLVAAGKPDRPLVRSPLVRPARLPDARAMEALRVASEAARHASSTTAPTAPPSPLRAPTAGRHEDVPKDAPAAKQ
jgi:undecaprenyl-diphosphatase